MVDVGAVSRPLASARRESGIADTDNAAAITVQAADEAALADYEAFCREAVHGPAQHPVWVRSWIAVGNADAIVVTVRRGGRPAFKLALEVVDKGPFRIARFVGGSHANGNFAAFASNTAAPASPAEEKALAAALRKARPDIDLVFLSRQNPHFLEVENPLSALATMGSPNVSLAVRLSGGFEALLERSNRKRKVKHYKKQISKFKQAGGFRLIEAGTPQEVERLLDAFFVLKGERLRKMGIANVFVSPQMQAFFRALFMSSLNEEEAPFVLHGLEVGGRIIAVNGLSVTNHSFVYEFSGIDDSDPTTSPGYFLNYSSIEWACRLDKKLYDFSVGDERFKRSWADVETWQFETLVPLGVKGRALAFYERSRAAAVRRVKSSPRLWALVKKLRARLGGEASSATAE